MSNQDALLQQALEAPCTADALPYLIRYKEQGDNPLAIQRILGIHALRSLHEHSPSSFSSPVPPNATSLEDALKEHLQELHKITNGLMEEDKVYANALQFWYQQMMRSVAQACLDRRDNLQELPVQPLIQTYEDIASRFAAHAPPVRVPIISFEQAGQTIERTANRIVYHSSILAFLEDLQNLPQASAMDVATNSFQKELKRRLTLLPQFAQKGEYTTQEQQQLEENISAIRAINAQKVSSIEGQIQRKQDYLYRTMEILCQHTIYQLCEEELMQKHLKGRAVQEIIAAADEFIEFTAKYSMVLEETPKEAADAVNKLLKSLP